MANCTLYTRHQAILWVAENPRCVPYMQSILQSHFGPISRSTNTRTYKGLHNEKRGVLVQLVSMGNFRVSLSLHLWTSHPNFAYYCVTNDQNGLAWKLHRRTQTLSYLHNSDDVYPEISRVDSNLACWTKVISITINNASVKDLVGRSSYALLMQVCIGIFFKIEDYVIFFLLRWGQYIQLQCLKVQDMEIVEAKWKGTLEGANRRKNQVELHLLDVEEGMRSDGDADIV